MDSLSGGGNSSTSLHCDPFLFTRIYVCVLCLCIYVICVLCVCLSPCLSVCPSMCLYIRMSS